MEKKFLKKFSSLSVKNKYKKCFGVINSERYKVFNPDKLHVLFMQAHLHYVEYKLIEKNIELLRISVLFNFLFLTINQHSSRFCL